jgi:ribosome recycling factor
VIDDIRQDADHRMHGAIDALQRELSGIRTGRASPGLVERLHVDYYGASTPLNQLAGVSAPESRLLVIQPWDRGSMAAIEKAILRSELGLTPNNDGQVIRLSIPPLTEERRRTLVRLVKSKVEEGKVAVRNVRRDAVDGIRELTREHLIGEDDERRGLHEIEALTKRYVDDAERLGQLKEAEVLEV